MVRRGLILFSDIHKVKRNLQAMIRAPPSWPGLSAGLHLAKHAQSLVSERHSNIPHAFTCIIRIVLPHQSKRRPSPFVFPSQWQPSPSLWLVASWLLAILSFYSFSKPPKALPPSWLPILKCGFPFAAPPQKKAFVHTMRITAWETGTWLLSRVIRHLGFPDRQISYTNPAVFFIFCCKFYQFSGVLLPLPPTPVFS
jgi:hypothetical protein